MQSYSHLSITDQELIEIAKKTIKEKYKQDFIEFVSVLRTKSGKIYTGINLKYRYRMAAMCSERVAIFKAEDDGENEFDTVVGLKYLPQEDDFIIVAPCAACRQVEIYYSGTKTILPDENNILVIKTIEELYPFPYK